MLQIPDPRERQMTRHDSTTSMEKTAPDMAPIPAPQMQPLSVARPRMAPVMAPMMEPTAARHGAAQDDLRQRSSPQDQVLRKRRDVQFRLLFLIRRDEDGRRGPTYSEDTGQNPIHDAPGQFRQHGADPAPLPLQQIAGRCATGHWISPSIVIVNGRNKR